jgi:hypothetical protein
VALDVTTQHLLVRLYIKPYTMRVASDNAVRAGDATWGRIIGANGRAVVDFTVSTKKGEGFMSFNTVGFRKGGPVSVMTRLAFGSRRRVDDEDKGRRFRYERRLP